MGYGRSPLAYMGYGRSPLAYMGFPVWPAQWTRPVTHQHRSLAHTGTQAKLAHTGTTAHKTPILLKSPQKFNHDHLSGTV
jgi:hypothetical protein